MANTAWDFRTAAANLDIEICPFFGGENDRGISTERKMSLRPGEPHPIFVGAHEMAHIVLGHTTDKVERFLRMVDFEKTNARQELEAHLVAMTVAEKLKLTPGTEWEPERETAYLAHYADHDADKVMDFMKRNRPKIFAAAAKIINAGMRQPVAA